ncbi:MAG: hypothetical protein LDL39_04335 [Magnetospirillum sp.]|nr:hypothetical protein [Magnetospirillum sp.]
MSKSNATPLVPKGFPWRSLLIGFAVVALLMGIGTMLFPKASTGGIFVVSALLGIGVFSASLG